LRKRLFVRREPVEGLVADKDGSTTPPPDDLTNIGKACMPLSTENSAGMEQEEGQEKEFDPTDDTLPDNLVNGGGTPLGEAFPSQGE